MLSMKIEGDEQLRRAINRIGILMSPSALERKTILIAKTAGIALHAASVRACMESIYDYPEMTYDRTMALLDAHRITQEEVRIAGVLIVQETIDIDPNATAEGDVHVGREMVIDYASYVHDGYTQWVWGYSVGQFVPGRFWFAETAERTHAVIIAYITAAFEEMIVSVMKEVVR